MISQSLQIEGVLLTQLRQISDARGGVMHMLRSDSLGFAGFGECYFSEVAPGALKAWKLHKRQTQNFAVPVGRIRLVVCDLRPESDSLGKLIDIELSRPDHYVRITVPPGLWYGFACLSQIPALLVNCVDMPHDPDESVALPPSDPRFPSVWAKHNHSII